MNKLLIGLIVVLLLAGCAQQAEQGQNAAASEKSNEPAAIDRESKIPADAVKLTPETDAAPVKSLSEEYGNPVPMPYPINTKGAEDSPFILPDGKTLYQFFTPDVRIPAEKQVIDGVTGIYVARKVDGVWQKPERVMLQNPGKISLDGCEFILGSKMWFCTAREGYKGLHWATAELVDGKWKNWGVDDFNPSYEVGELHMSKDGNTLYFHSNRPGGKGGMDVWMSQKVGDEWGEPVNLENVNSEYNEGWPALSPGETELWITKNYGLWRSKKVGGVWQTPELMFSPLAGEATIDNEGNVYFTHHFFKDDKMLEADIYVAHKITS